MDSLPEEFFEELNELLKVEALDELERDLEEVDVITDHLPEPKCGMDELVEKFQALDYLVGSNSEEEAEYWEMKAEIHYNV
jgi:hypothetical protein